MKQKRYFLEENEIPRQWYNIQADMPVKPMPMLNPNTKEPVTVEDLSELFCEECSRQELNTVDRWIDIPEEVLERYAYYRSTPLVRAYSLEEALGTPAKIYFKNESVSPIGSHKLNSALAQAYYCKKEGVTNVTTETGAGQWGAALSYASKVFGLESAVYQVKISYEQKPYRRSIMQVFGALVTPSPSMSTRAGKDILTKHPNHQGSLGTAISEAVELARMTPGCKYTLGSVMNHVTLHQTVIGLEAEKQMEMAGEYPDTVVACFGGGSNFGGIAFPFMRHNILEGKKTILLIEAFSRANEEQREVLRTTHLRNDISDAEKIATIKALYEALGVPERVEQQIAQKFQKALSILDALEVPQERTAELRKYAENLVGRKS